LFSHLVALDLDNNDEVIITGFTCDVVANSIIQAGLKPIYADIDKNTFCMNPKSVLSKISPNTKVIIFQHTFGFPAKINELIEIAKKHDLYIIEDCAVSLGSKYSGKYTGTFGDASIFSFELSKTITSCRGGMLLVNSNKLNGIEKQRNYYNGVPKQSRKYSINILFQLGLCGLLYRPRFFALGKYIVSLFYKKNIFKKSTTTEEFEAKMPPNYVQKLSGFQSIILLRQLKKLSLIKSRSIEIMTSYVNELKNNSKIMLPIKSIDHDFNMIRFPIIISNREDYLMKLENNDIEGGLWFTAPLSFPDINHKLFYYNNGSCPNSELISKKILNLPLHMRMIDKDIDKITNLLNSL